MKKYTLLLLTLFVVASLHATFQNNDDSLSDENTQESEETNYLVLTENDAVRGLFEKNDKGSFHLQKGQILCVRLEDTETCTIPDHPDGPFVKRTSLYSFKDASSQECLQLKKDSVGFTPEENLFSSAFNLPHQSFLKNETPHDSNNEHEWIFERKGPGETTLTFEHIQYEEGYNGACSPMCILKDPMTFKITTE